MSFSTATNDGEIRRVSPYPARYPGGKNRVYQTIINLIPPHTTYIEPFLGSGAVMRHKRAAALNIGIDLDPDVIKSFSSIVSPDVATRLYNADALEWLTQIDPFGDEFIYADPPYLMETRRAHRRIYRCEMGTAQQHADLLTVLTSLDCMVMISGYWSSLYAEMLSDWHTHTFINYDRSGNPATEWLWTNYPTPTQLHDYSYLGADYRERERIKRKVKRWVQNLLNMPVVERNAIMTALLDHTALLGDVGHHRQVRRCFSTVIDSDGAGQT